MALPKTTIRFVARANPRQLDELDALIALRRQELEEPPEQPPGERTVIERRERGKMTEQLELVKCGKNCTGCNPGHGPYWYGYFWDGGRVRSVYLGKPS